MVKNIYYMNDEQRPMRVRILDDRYDPVNATGDVFVTLQPCEAQMFEVHAPYGHVLYVKKWKDLVMISHIDPSVLSQSEQLLPPPDTF